MGQKHFKLEIKEEAVRFYISGHSIEETRARYGIAESTLFEWKKNYDEKYPSHDLGLPSIKERRQTQIHLEKLALELEVLQQCPHGTQASIDEKMAVVNALSGKYSIHVLCEALNLARGTYYNRKRREHSQTSYEINDELAKPLIEEVFRNSKERFGKLPIHYKLREQGYHISVKRIGRLMKEMGLEVPRPKYVAEHKRPFRRIVYRNLLSRHFTQPKPNLVWVSDITYVKVGEQYYFVCAILDLYSRRVLSYRISDTIDTILVMQTFEDAFEKRNRPKGLMLHSDQGVQYTSYMFREFMREKKVKQSFSTPGNPYDNSVCESFFRTLKWEAIYHHLYDTPEELEAVLDEYIPFYNGERPHSKLNMKTPLHYETEFFSAAQN